MIAALLLAATLPGLYAPASSAGVFGLEAMDSKAEVVAMEMTRELVASGLPRPVTVNVDPSTTDCSAKPYAAVMRLVTSADRGQAGWTFDAGLLLLDCAGWS